MTNQDLKHTLKQLLSLPAETETVEFKEAKNSLNFDDIGQYFSALSNEANLKKHRCGWLVFGIKDKDKSIVGTNFRPSRPHLDKLKGEIAQFTANRITFIEIHELLCPEGRVIMFQIPPAPLNTPVSWKGFWYGRDGESLVSLNLEELDRIRNERVVDDWSAFILKEATIEDLDLRAIKRARENYKNQSPHLSDDIDSWTDKVFLDKVKMTIKGKITRAAILLLGKPESEHYISPSVAKIRWVLKDDGGVERDYNISTCPFILSIDDVFMRIRKIRYRYIKDGNSFPDEVDKYDPYIIREAINNCIAHQDYNLCGRINVIEKPDELIFTNLGSFIPGTVDKVIKDDTPEEFNRNRFLVDAMVKFKMADTIGSGIRRMFNLQREKYFPLPDYEIKKDSVKVTITGKVLDLKYAQVLIQNPALTLEEIIMLDKLQKHKKLSPDEVLILKSKNLIEGKKPHYHISATIAQTTGQKALYLKNKGFDKKTCCTWIIKGIEDHGFLSRKDIDDLILDNLSNLMSLDQKKHKVNNILSSLRRAKVIQNIGTDSKSIWVLTSKESN